MCLFTTESETLDVRLTTGTTEHRVDRSGWTTFAAVVQRQILTSVYTTAGVFTTVNTRMMSLYHAKVVCVREHECHSQKNLTNGSVNVLIGFSLP